MELQKSKFYFIENGTSGDFWWSSSLYRRTRSNTLEGYFDNHHRLVQILPEGIHQRFLPQWSQIERSSNLVIRDRNVVISSSSDDRNAVINAENVTMEFTNQFDQKIHFPLHCHDCFLWIQLETNHLFDLRLAFYLIP